VPGRVTAPKRYLRGNHSRDPSRSRLIPGILRSATVDDTDQITTKRATARERRRPGGARFQIWSLTLAEQLPEKVHVPRNRRCRGLSAADNVQDCRYVWF
jgi:hypothetical protein